MNSIVHRFIQDAGNLTQSLGMGRIIGQIYMYLYFSPEPRSLSDVCEALGVSKGSVSTTVRQLEQWGAVQRVWVKGDRRDYYEATDWFGRIFKNVMQDIVGKRIEAHAALLGEAETLLGKDGVGAGKPDAAFIRDRIGHLRAFHDRLQGMWKNPLVQMLIK